MIPLTGADISYQIFDYYAKIAFGLRGLRPESYDITIFSPVRNSAFAVIRLLDFVVYLLVRHAFQWPGAASDAVFILHSFCLILVGNRYAIRLLTILP